MTLTMICGKEDKEIGYLTIGNGKTLLATALGYEFYHKIGKDVYTNYWTTFSMVKDPIEISEIFFNGEMRDGSLIVIDEIQ